MNDREAMRAILDATEFSDERHSESVCRAINIARDYLSQPAPAATKQSADA